jgi:hypothetical protein
VLRAAVSELRFLKRYECDERVLGKAASGYLRNDFTRVLRTSGSTTSLPRDSLNKELAGQLSGSDSLAVTSLDLCH